MNSGCLTALYIKKNELLHHNCGNTLVNEDVCTQNIIFCCLLPQTKDIEATLNHEFLKKQKKKLYHCVGFVNKKMVRHTFP